MKIIFENTHFFIVKPYNSYILNAQHFIPLCISNRSFLKLKEYNSGKPNISRSSSSTSSFSSTTGEMEALEELEAVSKTPAVSYMNFLRIKST